MQIIPGVLYLGDWEHAKAERKLAEIGITHILTVHVDPLPAGALPFKRLFCELAGEHSTDRLLLNTASDIHIHSEYELLPHHLALWKRMRDE